jgi:hypothetical protein
MTKKKTVPKITYKQLWDENVLLKERLESLEKKAARTTTGSTSRSCTAGRKAPGTTSPATTPRPR